MFNRSLLFIQVKTLQGVGEIKLSKIKYSFSICRHLIEQITSRKSYYVCARVYTGCYRVRKQIPVDLCICFLTPNILKLSFACFLRLRLQQGCASALILPPMTWNILLSQICFIITDLFIFHLSAVSICLTYFDALLGLYAFRICLFVALTPLSWYKVPLLFSEVYFVLNWDHCSSFLSVRIIMVCLSPSVYF